MKSSSLTQDIFPDLNFEDSSIRKAYEDLFENPCRFYFELKKAFIEYMGTSQELIDSFINLTGN